MTNEKFHVSFTLQHAGSNLSFTGIEVKCTIHAAPPDGRGMWVWKILTCDAAPFEGRILYCGPAHMSDAVYLVQSKDKITSLRLDEMEVLYGVGSILRYTDGDFERDHGDDYANVV